jgi:hypothetical protein
LLCNWGGGGTRRKPPPPPSLIHCRARAWVRGAEI